MSGALLTLKELKPAVAMAPGDMGLTAAAYIASTPLCPVYIPWPLSPGPARPLSGWRPKMVLNPSVGGPLGGLFGGAVVGLWWGCGGAVGWSCVRGYERAVGGFGRPGPATSCARLTFAGTSRCFWSFRCGSGCGPATLPLT